MEGLNMMKASLLRVLITLITVMLAISSPSFAAEEKKADLAKTEEAAPAAPKPQDLPGYYSPDHCDFEITFPEKPYLAQKCLPDGKSCYNLYSYTMVYDLRTTVDVSVTCNPSTPADFKRYNEAVMKAAMAGMVSERNLDSHSVNFREDKETKSAALSGTGMTGAQPKIYTSQIWIGQNSVFTVQAELIGGEHKEADTVFSEILRSAKLKKNPVEPVKPKAP
jgi:hypothetical protein